MYTVFVRNWWKEATPETHFNGLEPDPTLRKHTLAKGVTQAQAYFICQQYNRTHPAAAQGC